MCGQLFFCNAADLFCLIPREFPVQFLTGGFLKTFCQKGVVFGCFLSMGVWWAGWALLDQWSYRRGFLIALTKEVLFLLKNKLLAAKENIAKLNRTERVLHFKRLILFWQERKANASRGQRKENKKPSSPLAQSEMKATWWTSHGPVGSVCKTLLSSEDLEEDILFSEPTGKWLCLLSPWFLIIHIRDASH